jgi:hypothetical protein
MAVGLRARREWVEWLERLAAKNRTTKVGVIDRALTEFAIRTKFEEPPVR